MMKCNMMQILIFEQIWVIFYHQRCYSFEAYIYYQYASKLKLYNQETIIWYKREHKFTISIENIMNETFDSTKKLKTTQVISLQQKKEAERSLVHKPGQIEKSPQPLHGLTPFIWRGN